MFISYKVFALSFLLSMFSLYRFFFFFTSVSSSTFIFSVYFSSVSYSSVPPHPHTPAPCFIKLSCLPSLHSAPQSLVYCSVEHCVYYVPCPVPLCFLRFGFCKCLLPQNLFVVFILFC